MGYIAAGKEPQGREYYASTSKKIRIWFYADAAAGS